jgi:hypothetical protein
MSTLSLPDRPGEVKRRLPHWPDAEWRLLSVCLWTYGVLNTAHAVLILVAWMG